MTFEDLQLDKVLYRVKNSFSKLMNQTTTEKKNVIEIDPVLIGPTTTIPPDSSVISLNVEEIDGSPAVSSVSTVRVDNGSLTNDGGGVVTVRRIGTAQTYTPAGAATATLDLSLSNQHYITMPAGNITIALSNDTNNQIFLVAITQDSGGSRTVTWFTTIKWAGGSAPTLTTTASKRDVLGFIRTGSGTYDGFVIGQNI